MLETRRVLLLPGAHTWLLASLVRRLLQSERGKQMNTMDLHANPKRRQKLTTPDHSTTSCLQDHINHSLFSRALHALEQDRKRGCGCKDPWVMHKVLMVRHPAVRQDLDILKAKGTWQEHTTNGASGDVGYYGSHPPPCCMQSSCNSGLTEAGCDRACTSLGSIEPLPLPAPLVV